MCLDVIPVLGDTGARRIEDVLRPGKLVNVGPPMISTGGPVSNTGLNLKTLGNKVRFCARCGDDALDEMTVGILRRSGNADGIQIATGVGSSYTLVIAPRGIDRIFLHNPGTSDSFGPEDLDPAFIAECRHFHLGYPPLMRRMYESEGRELQQVFRIAREAGATRSLDMSLPDQASASGRVNWRAMLETTLRCAACLGLQNLRVLDAVSSARSWEETSRMMAQSIPLIDAHLGGTDWRWSQTHQIWIGPGDRLNR